MKTIIVKDDVYRKLNEIKGNKSFSDIIRGVNRGIIKFEEEKVG